MGSGQWLPFTRGDEGWEALAREIRARGVMSWRIQVELGTQLRNGLRSEGLKLRIVGPQPIPMCPAVMEEAGKDP